jgi:hypothetical protein
MTWLSVALCSVAFGCAEVEDDVGPNDNPAVTTDNGLSTTNGLACTNGLSTTNGLSVTNGLATTNGLSTTNGLMTTDIGRQQVAYLVRCALPANTSITKGAYTFQGLLGMAPEWQFGACDTTCQENVSACMLAHVNTAGVHIPLWLVAQNTAVGWGQDTEFPNQEGVFFGNVFVLGAHGTDPLKAPSYYCMGSKYNINPPAGRLGSKQTSPPYINPFGSANAACSTYCTPSDTPYNNDGYKACNGWNNAVTVWRQNLTVTGGVSGGMGKGFRWK